MKKLFCTIGLSALGLVGCSSSPQRPLYNWGSFPQLTYLTLSKPEKALPESQIQLLEKDIEIAKAKNLAVPPGLYAHLGMLYSDSHQATRAMEYFELEKQTYPESTTLMNRLLKVNPSNNDKVLKNEN